MKKPFSVGDRVRVYGVHTWYKDSPTYEDGKVTAVKKFLTVENEKSVLIVHPKQCRRLANKQIFYSTQEAVDKFSNSPMVSWEGIIPIQRLPFDKDSRIKGEVPDAVEVTVKKLKPKNVK